jgi:hypothetical protein
VYRGPKSEVEGKAGAAQKRVSLPGLTDSVEQVRQQIEVDCAAA